MYFFFSFSLFFRGIRRINGVSEMFLSFVFISCLVTPSFFRFFFLFHLANLFRSISLFFI